MRFASSRAYDLTTVRQPFDEMVKKSVNALLEHMIEDELTIKEITLPCELIVRGSVKAKAQIYNISRP